MPKSSRELPLVVLLPRGDTAAVDFLAVSGFEALADEYGFAVIAVDDENGRGLWPYVEATMDQLCIDRGRVFLVGAGGGGRTALQLSCQPWVTGVAIYAMRLLEGEELCRGEPVPRLQFMSTKSPMDPAEGGTGSCPFTLRPKISIAEMEDRLVAQHQCRSTQRALGQKACKKWTDCEHSSLVVCRVDGGQPWPGQGPRYSCDGVAPDFPAVEVTWTFFESLESNPESSDEPD